MSKIGYNLVGAYLYFRASEHVKFHVGYLEHAGLHKLYIWGKPEHKQEVRQAVMDLIEACAKWLAENPDPGEVKRVKHFKEFELLDFEPNGAEMAEAMTNVPSV